MKEFFCQQCRRHKKIELHASGDMAHALCVGCCEKAQEKSSRTEAEVKQVQNGYRQTAKKYKKPLSDNKIKLITGENK